MNTTTRRELSHRIGAFGLSLVLTMAILASLNQLALDPVHEGLQAKGATPAAVARSASAGGVRG